MKLTPIEPTSRSTAGVLLGYSINNKDVASGTLKISIHPDLIRKMKVKDGDPLRLDGDLKERIAQLTLVAALQGKATRKVHVESSGRGTWCISYSGLVRKAFPSPDGMTLLLQPEVTSDGLQFQLPPLSES